MLPDYLKPGLDVVFVGLNPGTRSALLGHYYAGRGNQFWPFLFESGFTDRRLKPEEDALILNYNLGLTDMVKRSTPGVGDLSPGEFRTNFQALKEKIREALPRIVCFNGKSGYGVILNRPCTYGLQEEGLSGVPVYLAPSTSRALPIPRDRKLEYYLELRTLIDRKPG